MYKDIDGSQYVIPNHGLHGSTGGLGGVAVLYKKELHDKVYIVRKPKDVDAHYM